MENVAILSQVKDYRGYIDSRVIEYIAEGQTETFESFGNFNLLAFDWYDISCPEIAVSKIMIYFDRENLFFFCEDQRACNKVKSIISDEIDGEITKETSKEKELYLFFVALLRLDMNHLDEFELAVTRSEDEALTYSRTNYLDKIIEYRKELLRLKRYYEQLVAIFDNLSANDNGLISHEGLRYFTILGHRAERFHQSVLNIRDYITQMREAYQAQIDIEQNKLMKVFTVVATIFLPLTLIVGWYGMNFTNMPELSSPYGYPAIILISLLLCLFLILLFKRKKWF